MKAKLLLSTFIFLLSSFFCAAQIPLGFNYQAIIRDANGEIMANEFISLQFTIYSSPIGGEPLSIAYIEAHDALTNEFGLVNVQIGMGQPILGFFTDLQFDSEESHLKTEVDTGSGWMDLGTQQLMSVPFALRAAQAETATNAWRLNGNAGTDGTNFIGTTDDYPFLIKVDNQKAGRIDLAGNVFMGYQAGNSNITGCNVGIGYKALFSNTEGAYNNAIGYNALYTNSTGSYNTANGNFALYNNATGEYNTATGFGALQLNADGDRNTATGMGALYSNNTGTHNTANGMYALYYNTTGLSNTAMGYASLQTNTNGFQNTAVGYVALYSNTGGDYNVAVGFDAGGGNTIGSSCTFIGFSAEAALVTVSNATAIGNQATAGGSNEIVIGNSTITDIGGYEPWSNLSDGRYKKNIFENVPGLDFILKLRPVTYNMEVNKLAAHLHEDEFRDSAGVKVYRAPDSFTQQSRDEKEQIVYTGFVAQEVEAAALSVGYDFSGVSKPDNENDLYALRYSEFTVPLVKAVQEQQTLFERQQREIELLKEEIQLLKQQIQQNYTSKN